MNQASLTLTILIYLFLSTSEFSVAQSISVGSLAQDTTVIDEKQSPFGKNIIPPKSVLEPLAYSNFINAKFDSSCNPPGNRTGLLTSFQI